MKENTNTKLYIAYGSNLNLQQMALRCPESKVVMQTTLAGRRLLFRDEDENAVANVEPCKGNSVPVLVWEITGQDEAALDRYEGFPFLYRKETVEITLGEKKAHAMLYIMNEGRPLGVPSCCYYSIILEGYKSAGFDVNILKRAAAYSAEGEEDGL